MDEFQAKRLVNLYADMILRISWQYLKQTCDAEDICQTVFLKYAVSTKVFESSEHEKAWLIRVTVNACKDLLKRFSRKHTIPLEELAEYVPDVTPEKYAVMEAVWSLPKQYRDVIYLHFYEGYTAPEIAGILNRNPNTVYTHLHKGKELLKEALGGVLNG